ncbi:MAG: MerR family transcriptional regulator [Chloroflexota bacterium]
MKTGECARLLGVDRRTIVLWIDREELRNFFSPSAKQETGGVQRLLTDNDVAVLNTIRFARTNGNDDWSSIAAIIEGGELQRDIPQNAGYSDTRMVPEQQARDFAKTAGTLAERDQLSIEMQRMQARIDDLEQRLQSEQVGRRDDMERLLREIAEAQAAQREAETILKLYESGRLKPKE